MVHVRDLEVEVDRAVQRRPSARGASRELAHDRELAQYVVRLAAVEVHLRLLDGIRDRRLGGLRNLLPLP